MDFRTSFRVAPGTAVHLAAIDPSFTGDFASHAAAADEIARQLERLDPLQYLLYADAGRSLLIVLQALDAGGKDGTVRHVFGGVDPQGVRVASFKEPTAEERAHDFLWRVHRQTPARGEIAVFNRSHYEDVLVVRVHELVPEDVWRARYAQIIAFEELLARNGTAVVKFFLHISPAEQLERFKARLDDPNRRWKISEADYSERARWPQYVAAYEEALEKTSTADAPWYVIPADHKWFRNLAVSQIVADTLADMQLRVPAPRVDLERVRREYEAAKRAGMPR